MNNLFCVFSPRRRQFGIRNDVRVRLWYAFATAQSYATLIRNRALTIIPAAPFSWFVSDGNVIETVVNYSTYTNSFRHINAWHQSARAWVLAFFLPAASCDAICRFRNARQTVSSSSSGGRLVAIR